MNLQSLHNLAAMATRSLEDTARAMREGWSASGGAITVLLALSAIAAAALIAGAAVQRFRREHTAEEKPLKIFRELAADLGISFTDRRLLCRISRHQKLPTPLTLLLSPRTMRRHAAAFSASLGGWSRLRLARRISRLRHHLASAG